MEAAMTIREHIEELRTRVLRIAISVVVISVTGVISPKFWRNNLRYAVLAIAIFGAAITPDGSGITMWFVAGPMIALYLVGMLIVERRAKRAGTEEYQNSI